MAFTDTTGYPNRKFIPNGQAFTNHYPKKIAGASGNVITMGASRVLSVRVSGQQSADVTWSYSKPTLTISGLVSTKSYDIEVDWR